MRTRVMIASCLAILLGSLPAAALEKSGLPIIIWNTQDHGEWVGSTTTVVSYYNNCTGWAWAWSGWSPGEQLGVAFDAPAGNCELNTTWIDIYSTAPSAYGFTGTITVLGSGDCSGPVLASQPFLPAVGWNDWSWGGLPVPSEFTVLLTFAARPGFSSPIALGSDHPAAGPTGPSACGICFPTGRLSHSRYYGVGGAYCPSGTTLNDGFCDIEWKIDANLACPVAIQSRTWGAIKGFYR